MDGDLNALVQDLENLAIQLDVLDEDPGDGRLVRRAIAMIRVLAVELNATLGHMINAKIDLETNVRKATAIATLAGGIARARGTLSREAGR